MLRQLLEQLEQAADVVRARLQQLEPPPTPRGRIPSAHDIAQEIKGELLEYLEEKTNPGLDPPPTTRTSKTDSERVRATVVAVVNEGKAARWDDFWKTWRKAIIAGIAVALLGAVGRLIEAAVRGHW